MTDKPIQSRRSFGKVRKLPSGRFQASYIGADGTRYSAPDTFDGRRDADAWLAARQTEISRQDWKPPVKKKIDAGQTFEAYTTEWVETRLTRWGQPLKPRTKSHYRYLLATYILPTFGPTSLAEGVITREDVRSWYAALAEYPTVKVHAYVLLHTIMASAVDDELRNSNPCQIRGAALSPVLGIESRPATLAELEILVDSLPFLRYRVIVLLAAWCALRVGELTELRRKDVDLKNGVLKIERAVTRAEGWIAIGAPKSRAGIRPVAIPPHVLPILTEHMATISSSPEALLFTASDGVSNMLPSALNQVFRRARAKAGRPDLRFHDLRHTGATLAAEAGATLAELMSRLGHSSVDAALRYQHASAAGDRKLADKLSAMYEAVKAP